MLLPTGSTVVSPVGLVASTMRSVLVSTASARNPTERYQRRRPVSARSAVSSSHRPPVENSTTTSASTAVAPQSRAFERV